MPTRIGRLFDALRPAHRKALIGYLTAGDPSLGRTPALVAALIRGARPPYDAILLDVDNGPAGLTRKANDTLYNLQGLSAAGAAGIGGDFRIESPPVRSSMR